VIRTNSDHRRAKVDWDRSQKQSGVLADHLNDSGVSIVITQGFIAGDKLGNTTTLGREGSDYSAAILAYLLDAEEVTIWKDVPGMLNADPRWFHNTVKLDKISFREAIELSYYGASVIHPKTIQPVKKKSIPLYVKSFMHPEESGSVIQESDDSDSLVPSYIFKPDQWLVSISPKDFSFIVEEHLTEIFEVLSKIGIKLNLMQNSAISFSFAVDADKRKIDRLLTRLSGSYKVRYNTGLQLLTVRHYDEQVIKELTKDKEVLLEQRSRSTVRMVLRGE
jgi:aspartate kinase